MISLVFCFFAPFTYDQYTLPKIALAAVLLSIAWARADRVDVKPLTFPMLLMLACVAISAALSGDPLANVFGLYMGRYYGLIPLVLCFLAYQLPPVRLHGQMRLAGALMSVYALSQLVWTPLDYDVLSLGHRVAGSLGSPPTMGCALAMCLPFCFGKTKPRILLTLLVLAALAATGSRGPILAAVVAVVVYDPLERRKSSWVILGAILLALGVLASVFHHGASDVIRLMVWKTALRVWWAHPWFGAGGESYVWATRAFRDAAWIRLVGPFSYQDHAHNDILHVLGAFGAAGAAAYAWLHWKTWEVLRISWQSGYRSAYPAAIAASLAAMFVCAKFNAVPFACLFAAALMLGKYEGRRAGRNIIPPVLPAMAASLLAGVLTVMVAADVIFYRARRVMDFPGIMRAAWLNPAEVFYQAHEVDLLTRKFGVTDEPGLILRALQISSEAVKLHPANVQAQHMLTQTLLILASRDPHYLADAKTSADKLYAMDPALNFKFHVVKK